MSKCTFDECNEIDGSKRIDIPVIEEVNIIIKIRIVDRDIVSLPDKVSQGFNSLSLCNFHIGHRFNNGWPLVVDERAMHIAPPEHPP